MKISSSPDLPDLQKTQNNPQLSDGLIPLAPDAKALTTAKASLQLFGKLKHTIDGDTGEVEDSAAPNEFECEDLVLHGNLLEQTGCGLSRHEMYVVMMTMKKLGEDANLGVATARFFGKVLGTHRDYYIFETTLQTPPEPLPEKEGEVPHEAGVGVNAFTYFVCNELGGPFTMLSDVTPGQIKAARVLKKVMTGNLDAPVSAYPPFPGRENAFLRTQIARIAHATTLAPSGMFTVDEDSGEVTKAEEFEALPADEMISPENWVHKLPHIKMQGRCEVWKPEEEDEEEEREPTEEEAEEGPEALSPAMGDAPVMGSVPWTAVTSSKSGGVKFKVVALRSNLWPGAAAVVSGTDFANIYVGWAVKNAKFVPVPPPAVAFEFEQKLIESVDLPPRVVPEAEEEE